MTTPRTEDRLPGVHFMIPRDEMSEGARKLRGAYERVPGALLVRREFGYYSMDRWVREGKLARNANLTDLFFFDPYGKHDLGQLGWCEAAFRPAFEEKIIEDRGAHEVVQDYAGRRVLFFKGRRNGFMPTYLDHPVKDLRTWEEDVRWRLDPTSPERYADLEGRMANARRDAAEGKIVTQNVIGGYMYLRSLIGPEDLLYAFVDQPRLIHACMEAWFALAEAVIERHQRYVTIDEIYFGEDICYNHGPLISPAMMREFILPYYQQVIANLKRRQLDPTRHLYVQIDTDGYAVPVIDVYREAIGMDVMSPFEVAAGCDVVAIGKRWLDLAIFGGIDKRVLAAGKDAIDRMVERILPTMWERGGYIPTCDHGVPEEVDFDDYLHYRRRCVELGG